MFVLCPHCHFLVGMDPRTGGPPAACPKCGGMVVDPVAATRADAPALDPFAEAALPSVAPTLPSVEPAVDAKAGTSAAGTAERNGEPATDTEPASATDASVASVPAMGANADAPEATAGASAAAPAGQVDAADAPRNRATADEMIAALATRPARKPRAPRTRSKKPAAPTASAAEADAGTPPPVAATKPSAPAPSAAAGLGARIRRLFARTPRQPGVAQPASADAAAAPVPDASPDVADATPATPALSIRNRKKRSGTKGVESPPETSGTTAAPGASGESVSAVVAVSAAAEAVSVAANAPEATSAALPSTVAAAIDIDPRPGADASPVAADLPSPRRASPGPDRGEAGADGDLVASADAPADASLTPPANIEAAGSDVGHVASTDASTDAAVTPPENIDAAAAALVAGVPATATQAAAIVPPTRLAPSFATARATNARTRRDYRAVAVALALMLVLGLQLLLAQRAVLAADPGWRPTIAALCGVLRCALPPWREPAAFTMLSRHVRPHPDAPGTLLIDASFRNDARWPQPWPRLELTLSDVDGRTVGARTFDAREYLGAPPTQSGLAPGQSASLSLAVVEPAPDIVSFTFDFR